MSRAAPPPPPPSASSHSSRRSTAAKSAGLASLHQPAGITAQETSHAYRPSPIDHILAEQGLERYHLEPPTWRAPWIVKPSGSGTATASKQNETVPSVGLGPNKSLIRLAGAPAPVAGSGGAAVTYGTAPLNAATNASGTAGDDTTCSAWPVFYPPHDGLDEDRLTEQVVKQGFAAKSLVSAETFSAHQHIYDKLKTGDILGNLSRLVSAVREKAESQLPTYGPSTFRLPSRITLTDSKREAWFSDLASPSVPLSKLSRSVPHGYKGEKGLDMLAHRKVEIDRAVWFVRAFGGVEIQSLAKSRPLATAIYLYTTEFTGVVCEFLRKQLGEVVLPGAAANSSTSTPTSTHASPLGPPVSTTMANTSRARSGSLSMQAKAAAAASAAAAAAALSESSKLGSSGLLDETKRKAWEEKYHYTIKLISSLYRESLLDRLQFLRFLVSLLESKPLLTPGDQLGQLSFALSLIDSCLDDIFESEPETARLVSGCASRLQDLELVPTSSLRDAVRANLASIVKSAFGKSPDAFAPLLPSPVYSSAAFPLVDTEELERVLTKPAPGKHGEAPPDTDVQLRSRFYAEIADLRARRQLLSATLQAQSDPLTATEDLATDDRARLAAIEHLDAFEFPQRIQETHRNIFVTPSSELVLRWDVALPLLFTYATTTSRPCGPHRRYAAAKLISLERERLQDGIKRITRSSSQTGLTRVEDAFVRWVDGLDAPIPRSSIRSLAEELFRTGVMNYGAYLQRMIARGETERDSDAEGGESIHLWILRTVPLESSLAGVKSRIAGGGRVVADRARRIEHTLTCAKQTIEDVFSPDAPRKAASVQSSSALLFDQLDKAITDGAHWSITREMIPNALSSWLPSAEAALALPAELVAVAVQVFKKGEDWAGLLQLLATLVQLKLSEDTLDLVVDVLESRLDIWAALDSLPDLSQALVAGFASIKKAEQPIPRRLLSLLVTFAGHDLVDSDAQSLLKQELQSMVVAASPTSARQSLPQLPVPLPEMQALLTDSSPAATSQLASSLWYRYRGHPHWITALLDSSVLYIPQLGAAEPLIDLITELESRTPLGVFSAALAPWTSNMSAAQAETIFGGAFGEATASLFAELGIAGVFDTPALLKDLVAPVRRSTLKTLLQATSTSGSTDTSLAILHNVQLVFAPVIAPADRAGGAAPFDPRRLVRRQRISARRAALTRSVNLPTIAEALAGLIVEQEAAKRLGYDDVAEHTGAYFVRLASLPRLQALFARVPRALRDGMLDNEALNALPMVPQLRPNLLAGLLVVLKDGGAASPASLGSTEELDIFLSGLSIWRLNVSKVELVACLERLELDPTISTVERHAALHTLSGHFLERVCSGDGKSYLGEQVVRCYRGTASDELVSVAFERLADALGVLSDDSAHGDSRERATTVVRTTSTLLDKFLQNGTAISRIASAVRILGAIRAALLANCRTSSADTGSNDGVHDPVQIARLALLALRCLVRPKEGEPAELLKDCLILFAFQAAGLSKGSFQQSQQATNLLDACSAILYALPDIGPCIRAPTLASLVNAAPPFAVSLDELPDAVLDRLCRLFGPRQPASSVRNPWELLDHADPAMTQAALARKAAISTNSYHAPPSQLVNLGPIDLATFRARVIATIPAVTAVDASSNVSTSSAHSGTSTSGAQLQQQPRRFEKGRQTNFDFETPCTTLGVAARDHRRTLNVTRLVSSRLEAAAAASAQAALTAAMANKKTAAPSSAARPASTTPAATMPPAATATPAATSGRGAKRRNSQQQGSSGASEVVVIDSDEEGTGSGGKVAAGLAAPKAKKAKTASNGSNASGTSGKTASKTTAGKAPSKTTRKRK